MANLVQGTKVSGASAAEALTLPAMPVRLQLKDWQVALLEGGNGGPSGGGSGGSGPSGGGPSSGSGDPGSGGEGGSPSTEG